MTNGVMHHHHHHHNHSTKSSSNNQNSQLTSGNHAALANARIRLAGSGLVDILEAAGYGSPALDTDGLVGGADGQPRKGSLPDLTTGAGMIFPLPTSSTQLIASQQHDLVSLGKLLLALATNSLSSINQVSQLN